PCRRWTCPMHRSCRCRSARAGTFRLARGRSARPSRSSPPVAASWPTPPGRAGRRTPSPVLREPAAQRCPPCSSVCRELFEGRLLGSADLLGGGRGGLGHHLFPPVDRGPGEVEDLLVVRAGHRALEGL